MAVAVTAVVDCYFGIHDRSANGDSNREAIVAFSIPDIGIQFKAPFEGVDRHHCAWASLLALLEFIDSNQKYFSNHSYQIFGNDIAVINQANGRDDYPANFEPLLMRAATYRDKYGFSLAWIPTAENAALDELLD